MIFNCLKSKEKKEALYATEVLINSRIHVAHMYWNHYEKYKNYSTAHKDLYSYREMLTEICGMLEVLHYLGYKTIPRCFYKDDYLNKEIPFDSIIIEAP